MLKLALAFAFVASLVALSCALDSAFEEGWRSWKTFHRKSYPQTVEAFRRTIWEKNLCKIEQHNLEHSQGKHSYVLEMNHFGDMTDEEFHQLLNGFILEPEEEKVTLFQHSDTFKVPKEVDWRTKGYVTPVKNQGHCGSCWAFSATGALEGQVFKKTGQLISLSEQNLVDCSKPQGNHGCSGGYITGAFRYVQSNGGINSETTYPYLGRDDGMCHYNPLNKAANCTSFVRLPQGSEEILEQAVASVGPVSVAVDAKAFTFRFYHSGVYSDSWCSQMVNHAMLTVGYSTSQQNGKSSDYWLIKNSWTENWGEQGYLRLLKGAGNQCGVANQASYPVL
nr:cathepsin L1-like isoform X2 [Geotrypetes seraphini]XP_033809483.1 cathepsin L1-like isoform X2 [Geotrypetes seraphini]